MLSYYIMNKGPLRKALLIGINYNADERNKLYGCINDVKNVEKKLAQTNPECKNIRILTDDSLNPLLKPTRINIINSFTWLLSNLQKGDSILFHYSGHGGLTVDLSGDEESKYDSCIYPIYNKKIEMITDDELRLFFINRIPASISCFAIFDCCHSGTVLDFRYNFSTPTPNNLLMSQNNKYTATPGSVICLSGCQDNQTAADTVDVQGNPSGALTNALLNSWNTYGTTIKYKNLLWDVYQYLKSNNYPQVPYLSCSNVDAVNKLFN